MSNTFITPRSVSTLAQSRIDYNNSLTALLQNFSSSGQPSATSVNLEGVTGLKSGMLWYKAGSNTADGQGRVLVYDGVNFVRTGIAVYRMPSGATANIAIGNNKISSGELIDIGNNRLYMVNSSNTGYVDIGLPPTGYTVDNADTLDNLNSTQFLRSDVADTIGGPLTGNPMLRLTNTTFSSKSEASLWLSGTTGALLIDSNGNKRITWNDGNNFGIRAGVYTEGTVKYTDTGSGAAETFLNFEGQHGQIYFRVADIGTAEAGPVWQQTLALSNSGLTLNSNTVWHAGNDGAGSGLDADTLDGTQLVTIQSAYASNDGITLATARGNDHATLLSARANDFTTYTTLSANDGATLATARGNDHSTYTTLSANDGATLASARGNDHATLLSARANDYTTWSGLNSYTNLKANTASPTFTGTVTGPTFNATSLTGGGFQGIDADSATQPSFTWSSDLNTGMYRSAVDAVSITTGGTARTTVSNAGLTINSGNFYIPDSIYHSGDTDTRIRFPAADTVSVETAGVERLRVTSAGRVGIGNTAPAHDFSVSGSAFFSGAVRFGDPNSYAILQSGNPLYNFDSSDYFTYNRAADQYQFRVDGGLALALTAGQISGNVVATQAQAEAGTLDTKIMTPLRVKQAIDKLITRDLLVSDNSFSGTLTQVITYSGLPSYPSYEVEYVLGASITTTTAVLSVGFEYNGVWSANTPLNAAGFNISSTGPGGIQGVIRIKGVNSDRDGGGIIEVNSARVDTVGGVNVIRAANTISSSGLINRQPVTLTGIRFLATTPNTNEFGSNPKQYVRIYGVKEV